MKTRGADQVNDGLVDVLLIIVVVNRSERKEIDFKVPQLDGKADFEYFIFMFKEITDVKYRRETAIFLYIRETTKTRCRKTVEESSQSWIFSQHRRTSPREVTRTLNTLLQESIGFLKEHSTAMTKLVVLAYSDLAEDYQNQLSLDTFCCTLGTAYLQGHLHVVDTPTLEAVVCVMNKCR